MPRQKFIVKCTPTLGMVSLWWHLAVSEIFWPMNYGKLTLAVRDVLGDEIAEVRNKIVTLALGMETAEKEITHLLWIDDDVICTRGALLQLLHHDRDIASGVYFTKAPDGLSEPLIFPYKGGGTDKFVPNKSYEVWGHGMGLCLIKTGVYKRMREELNLPLDKYGRTEWYRKTGRPEELEIKDGVLQGGGTEDLYFLDKAGSIGYKPLIDTGKHTFGFHYDSKRHKGFPERQWKQYEASKPVIWDTPDGEVVWE